MKEQIEAMGAVCIKAIIDGVPVTYDSRTQTFWHNNKAFKLNLGKRVYKPIYGFLVISQIDLEKLNYRRAQENLALFKTASQAVLWLLETQQDMHLIKLIAQRLLINNVLIDESVLLRKMGYNVIFDYYPQTSEEAMRTLKDFSLCQTAYQQANFYGINIPICIKYLEIYNKNTKIDFYNDNLAQEPVILTREDFADSDGIIKSRYVFEPIKIIQQHFSYFVKPFGDLTKLTLVNNKLYDLSPIDNTPLTICPSCNKPLTDNKCTNYYCKEKVIERAYCLASKDGLNIRGLSRNTLTLIYDYLRNTLTLKADRISDAFFFFITKEDIKALKLKKAQSELLYSAIEQAKAEQKLSDILYGMRLFDVSKSDIEAISKACYNDMTHFISVIEHKPFCQDNDLLNSKEILRTLYYLKDKIQKIN